MLKQGDCIRLYLAEETIEEVPRGHRKTPAVSRKKTPGVKLDVIYEDEHVAMVNKPAGMLSQKAKTVGSVTGGVFSEVSAGYGSNQ